MRTIILTFSILVAAYSGFVAFVPSSRDGVTVSQEALNRQTVERYRYRIDAPVVIVGSSLAARLAAAINSPCAYDLAIAGGSPMTGLAIIADKPHQPRLVLVEVNLLDRPIDARFAEPPLWFRRYLPLTWVENSPVSRLLTVIADIRGSRNEVRASAAMRAEPLRLQQASYDQPPSAAVMARSIAELRGRVDAFASRGIATMLFEMPVHPSLEDRPRARMIREAVRAAFPAVHLVDARTLATGMAIRTADGVHLEKDEAAAVLQRLLAAVGPLCSGPAEPARETVR